MNSRRVLIVDDSALTLDMTRAALEEIGILVATANTMRELELHDPANYDLILMDVQMPELYGDDVAATLKHVRNSQARMVLFSNLPAEELATRARDAGVDGYICKQSGLPAIVQRVTELLA